tara:strand:- start:569 stop:1165 length:597 start_codon:yes stop_codon:yes gene_type:complete
MELIAHRLNRIIDLKKLPKKYGAEVDLRTKGSKIILNHEPYRQGESLENYLSFYNHGTLILNIKESGLEKESIKLAKRYKIKKFFILDSEMPLICTNKKKDNKYFSVRFSEYESVETLKNFVNNVRWVWIDTFKKLPVRKNNTAILKRFKSCLVCPERWGRPSQITLYYKQLRKLNFFPDSIMTGKKYFKIWDKLINR